MKVAVYYGEGDIRTEDRPVPEPGPGEVLIKVLASGICGSDVMGWYRRGPVVLGHEVAGVLELSRHPAHPPGQRVVAAHHVPCGVCHYCLRGRETVCDTLRSTHFDPGGFAQYLRLPAINTQRGLYVLPQEVSFEEGTFVEPLACVLRGLRHARLRVLDAVLVLGAGVSGLLHVQAAKALGARVVAVSDPQPWRLRRALQLGADAAFDAREDVPGLFRKLNDSRGADVVVLTTGAPQALGQALEAADRGAAVLLFAPTEGAGQLPVELNEFFWRQERMLISSYAAGPLEHRQALEFIRSGKVRVKEMITHRLPLQETARGFSLVRQAGESLKVIIEPHGVS
jgi:L-iditol 2-dehydrogenase